MWIVLLVGLLIFGLTLFYQGHTIAGIILPLSAIMSILMFLKGLTDNQPRIMMDEEGISATEFSGIKILWRDIEKVEVIRFPRVGRIITFKLFNEAKYTYQLAEKQKTGQTVNRLLGATSFTIIAEGLDTHPNIIYDEIVRRTNQTVL